MKSVLFFSFLMVPFSTIFSQSIGIGTNSPSSSAQLDVSSTTKGFLLPRMNTAQRNAIVNPAAGLQIFNLDQQSMNSYDGRNWVSAPGLRLVGSSADAAHATSNSWTQKADFGGIARNAAVGFSIGSKGYLGTGYIGAGVYKKDFWEYDPVTNAWTQKADFGGDARASAVGFSIGFKGYVGTGINETELKRDFWEYDPNTNAWQQKASFGGTQRLYAVGFSMGGYGYLGTGTDTSASVFTRDFWQYNPVLDTWIQKADFAGGLRTSAIGFSISDKGYVGIGYNGSIVNDFWEYDTTTNSWLQKADFAGGPRRLATGFSMDNKGYIGIGQDLNNDKNDFWQYDPVNNNWVQKAVFPGELRQGAVGFSIGSKGYFATGFDGIGNIVGSKELWEYMDDNQVYAYTSNAVSSTNSVSDGAWTLQNNTVYNSNFGKVGIGTPNPSARLHVAGDLLSDGMLRIRNSNSPAYFGKIEHSGSGGNFHLDTYGNGGIFLNWFSGTGVIIGNGASGISAAFSNNGNLTIAGTLTQNSDERLKTNILPLQTSLDNLEQLSGYTYNWKDATKDNDQQIGLLAQEVQKIYPQLVKQNAAGELSVNYIGLVPVLIESIKQQQRQIGELKQMLNKLMEYKK